ncbi:hypothetical protein ScPMuIL_010341 [Solemya velum]
MSGDILQSATGCLVDDQGGSDDMEPNSAGPGQVYRETSFRDCYHKEPDQSLCFKDRLRKRLKTTCTCDSSERKDFLHGMFPFFKIMRKYKWKSMLPNDVVAGLTVGVMLLPQGVAFAMLAELPPMVGLYLSFFPVILYFFLGTSRHINIGSVAVVSLMVGSVVLKYEGDWNGSVAGTNNTDPNTVMNVTSTYVGSNSSGDIVTVTLPTQDTHMTSSVSEDEMNAKKIGIAATICIICGVFQVALGVLRLGLVTTYMSEPLIRGFTTGVAVHVFTSQVKTVLGLRIKRFPGVFQIVNTYFAIFENIEMTNFAELLISLICIAIIYLVKVQINVRFKKKLKFPIPIELIVVILATVISHFGKFRNLWSIRIVGHIPAGLPLPTPPSFHDASSYISDAITIAIVAFAQSISLVSLLAKRNHYETDANQELIAYGLSNIFGSFFSCYPVAASLSRSTVQEATGGKTQVASLASATLILIVILWIGPLFETLPNCVLSAIIIVALRGMFLQILELRPLWKTSKYDFFIWLVTFLSVVVLHVDYGLAIGILFSFYTVILRTQRAKTRELELVPAVGVFKDSSKYMKTQGSSGTRIVGYDAPLYYANAEMFIEHIYQLTGVDPEKYRKIIKKHGSIGAFNNVRTTPSVNGQCGVEIIVAPDETTMVEQAEPLKEERTRQDAYGELPIIHTIIIDFSAITFVDTVGVKALKTVYAEYDTVGIKVLMATVGDNVWSVLQETGFCDKHGDSIYLTIKDALSSTSVDWDSKEILPVNGTDQNEKNTEL